MKMDNEIKLSENWKSFSDDIKNKETYKESDIAFQEEYQIAKVIHEARKECGLTQAQLATIMGTNQNVISRIEKGYMGVSFKKLTEYAHAMGKQVKIELV
jgi:ribosome-binding protein aMBF1 (putative translation factor)